MFFRLLVCANLALIPLALAKPIKVDNQGHPPVEPVEANSPDHGPKDDTGLHYDAYLKQVVDVLESDAGFKKRLETSNAEDIKNGKIAMHLEMVNHTVRTKLDELKREEIERMKGLLRARENLKQQGKHHIDLPDRLALSPLHLDHKNEHTFEIKDLEMLIKQTTNDLEELDKQRKAEFKDYEMEKKFEEEEALNHMTPEDREKEKLRLEALKKKHNEHPKIHHPGSKAQLEEVWDEEDHLQDQDFDPLTFFHKHDVNQDGSWGIDEVEGIFQHELDKLYDPNNPQEEDDPMERYEEMNRMREEMMKNMDKNHDSVITQQEFLDYTGQKGENPVFNQDEGWEDVEDEKDLFTDEEYQEYLRQHHAQPGVVQNPPDPNLHFQPEHHEQQQQQHFDQQQQHHEQQQQQHHEQQQQQHHEQQQQQHHQQQQQHHQQQQQHFDQQQQHHQQQQQLNQQPGHQQQQQQFNQHPNQNQQFNGAPQHQQAQQPNAVPVNAVPQHPNAVPQHPNAVPQHPNAVPQHPNAVPQQPKVDQEALQKQLNDLQEKLKQQQQPKNAAPHGM